MLLVGEGAEHSLLVDPARRGHSPVGAVEAEAHHQAERLRDAIINEALDFRDGCLQEGVTMEMDWPSQTLKQVVEEFVDIDELELRRSAHQFVRTRNRVHRREIFRILRAAAEKQRYTDRG